jgi:transposase
MLTRSDQVRLAAVHRVVAGTLRVADAAEELGLSIRQFHRILAAYRAEGLGAIPHRNRGRQPAHTTSPAIRDRVCELSRTTFANLNDSQFRDVLEEREGIVLSRSTVRRLRLAIGHPSPRRRQGHRLDDAAVSSRPSYPSAIV